MVESRSDVEITKATLYFTPMGEPEGLYHEYLENIDSVNSLRPSDAYMHQ